MHNHIALKDKTSFFYRKITGCTGLVLELLCMIAWTRVGYRQMNLKQDLSLCCMFPLNYNEIKSKDCDIFHWQTWISEFNFCVLTLISLFLTSSLNFLDRVLISFSFKYYCNWQRNARKLHFGVGEIDYCALQTPWIVCFWPPASSYIKNTEIEAISIRIRALE